MRTCLATAGDSSEQLVLLQMGRNLQHLYRPLLLDLEKMQAKSLTLPLKQMGQRFKIFGATVLGYSIGS